MFDQTRTRVEQYSREGKKKWSLYEYDQDDKGIALTSVNFEISLMDLYNKVKFERCNSVNNQLDLPED